MKPECDLKTPQTPSRIRQLLGGIHGWVTGLLFGLNTAYVSVGLDSFQKEYQTGNSPFEITVEDVGTFGGAMNLGGIAGGLCSSYITRRFGRKKPCILILIPYIAGWALIAFPVNFTMMVAGQAICGFAQGFRAAIGRMHLAEVSHPNNRGRFLSGIVTTMLTFQLVTYIAALFLTWQPLAIFCTLVPVLFFPLVMKVPESPVWLVTQGRLEEARDSLQWYYGDHYNVDNDFLEVVSHHKDSKEAINSWTDICRFQYLKPVIIMFIFVFLVHFCGGTTIQFFMSQIVRKSKSSLDPKYGVVILGFVAVIALSIAGVLIDIIGRRRCIMVSGVWMGLGQLAVGAYFFMDEDLERRKLIEGITWIPVLLLSISIIGFSLGMSPLVLVLMGEIIPIQIKNEANALFSVMNLGCAFLALAAFPFFVQEIRTSGTFWLYSCCCFLVVGFIVAVLPETKGRSLGDIERKLTDLNTSVGKQ